MTTLASLLCTRTIARVFAASAACAVATSAPTHAQTLGAAEAIDPADVLTPEVFYDFDGVTLDDFALRPQGLTVSHPVRYVLPSTLGMMAHPRHAAVHTQALSKRLLVWSEERLYASMTRDAFGMLHSYTDRNGAISPPEAYVSTPTHDGPNAEAHRRRIHAALMPLDHILSGFVRAVVYEMEEESYYLEQAFDMLSLMRGKDRTTDLAMIDHDHLFSLAADAWRLDYSDPENTDHDAIDRSIDAIAGTSLGTLNVHTERYLTSLGTTIERFAHHIETNGASEFEPIRFESAIGSVLVAGAGDDTHNLDGVALVIDLGGDDTYTGMIATTPSLATRTAAVIDLAGDDVYEGTIARAAYSVVLLFDRSGNDTYTGTDAGLCTAFHGVSVLIDESGDDTYTATGAFTQGAAHVGAALLIDRAGNDTYTAVEQSQGYGGTLGFGAIVDGAGDDTYTATGTPVDIFHDKPVTLSQGVGFGRRDGGEYTHRSLAGGMGALIDGGGDDRYSVGVYGLGAGYWWAGGLFYDHSGDDRYECLWYSIGAAPHYAYGIAIDRAGSDAYNVGHEEPMCQYQGVARDASLAIFIDGAGEDEYWLKNRCAGSADLSSIALFWDRGGADTYRYATGGPYHADPSFGDGLGYEQRTADLRREKGLTSIGLFFDTGPEPDVFTRVIGPEQNESDLPAFYPLSRASWVNANGPDFGKGVNDSFEAER